MLQTSGNGAAPEWYFQEQEGTAKGDATRKAAAVKNLEASAAGFKPGVSVHLRLAYGDAVPQIIEARDFYVRALPAMLRCTRADPATGFGHGDHGATQDEPTTALGQLRECLYGASYELGLQRVGGEVTFWEPGAVRGARWAGRVQGRFVFVEGGFIRTYLFRAFVFRNGQVDFVRQVASAFGTWSGYASANRNHRRDQRKECSTAWGEKEWQSWGKVYSPKKQA